MTLENAPSNRTQYMMRPLLALGLMLSLVMIFLEVHQDVQPLKNNPLAWVRSPLNKSKLGQLANACTTDITDTAKLSREQLLQLLAIPERDKKEKVKQVIKEPYCQLSSIKVRAGVDSIREAYPLAFDPNTAIVILYENDEYAGYRFKHQ